MLEVLYVYVVLLGGLYVYKTLSTDPEKDQIWGSDNIKAELLQNEKENELLRAQLEHYRNYHPAPEKIASREEQIA